MTILCQSGASGARTGGTGPGRAETPHRGDCEAIGGQRIIHLPTSVEQMDCEPAPQFRLEPCSLGRHYLTRVCYVHKLFHRDRIEGESHGHLPGIHPAGKLSKAADASHEINTAIRTQILDAK